jgi:hypothetical protein
VHCDCARHCCSHAPTDGAVLPAALMTEIVTPAKIPEKVQSEFVGGCSVGVQLSSVGGLGALPEQEKQVLS